MNFTKTLIIPVAALTFGFGAPAFADCAADLERVTSSLAAATISDADRAKIEESKTMAMEKQNTGDDSGCQADLAMAKTILQLE